VQAAGGVPGAVENEDYASALLRLSSGARVVPEASRVAVAEQNSYGFEIHGTAGALFWDFRRMGELGIARGDRYEDEPVSTVLVGPGAAEYAAFQPRTANAMSFDDLKVIEAHQFLRSIAEGRPSGSVPAEAVASAVLLDAMTESVAHGRWVELAHE
jgi:predicted dehydrogenase